MIDVPAHVSAAPGVKVVAFVQVKNIRGPFESPAQTRDPLALAAFALGLGDALTEVFDDDVISRNVDARINAAAMNSRTSATNYERLRQRRIER